MHDRADADGVDLLLIDTGDRIEGNGLYDGSEPKGLYTFDIFREQHIDLICSGNHELYMQNSSENEFYKTVPNFRGNYLASNLDIYSPDTGDLEPLAPRFKKFTTKNQGIRILAFSFLFDFQGNANNTVVMPVERTVEEDWFQEAIRDRDVDLIIVFGHVAVRSKEYNILFKTIRSVQWDTPLQFFAGHTHIRDYKIYDRKSAAIESGRYMETIGFMSIDGLEAGGKANDTAKHELTVPQRADPTFSRRYIDNNLFSLYHHSSKNSSTFPTAHGLNVSLSIASARKHLKLDTTYGCAPHDLWANRAPFPSKQSIFSWLQDDVLPSLKDDKRMDKPALIITNTGAMRFDIFAGPFTKDTEFLVSPFTSGLRFIKDVPYSAASRVLAILNSEGPIMDRVEEETGLEAWMLVPPEQVGRDAAAAESTMRDWRSSDTRGQAPLGGEQTLTPGYTTRDDAGTDGDDTLHSPITFYNVPNCIQAAVGFTESTAEASDVDHDQPETVDVVFNEFIQSWVLLALEFLGQKYDSADTAAYMEGKSFTDMITDWVREHWSVEGEHCP